MLLIQVSLLYSKHLEDRKALFVHIYCTWCDIILIFQTAEKNSAYASFFCNQFENSNDVTDNAFLSSKC